MRGGEEGGGGGWGDWKRATDKRRTHFREGRKREGGVSEVRNLVRHKRGLTNWRGGRRSGLVSLEKRGMSKKGTHHMGGRKREKGVGELGKVEGHKQGCTYLKEEREKSRWEEVERRDITTQGS